MDALVFSYYLKITCIQNQKQPVVYKSPWRTLGKMVGSLHQMLRRMRNACPEILSEITQRLPEKESYVIPLHAELVGFGLEIISEFMYKRTRYIILIIRPIGGQKFQASVMKMFRVDAFKHRETVRPDQCNVKSRRQCLHVGNGNTDFRFIVRGDDDHILPFLHHGIPEPGVTIPAVVHHPDR